MPKYYTMSCSKGVSCKRKNKRVSLYAKSSRPFAPEYSTSTISKAINLVYGMPEFPNNPRAWDVPGTTHFNIFHRSGVSNGNDVLGQVTSDEFRNHPNNHGADDTGASATTGVDPDDVFKAARDGQNLQPRNVHVVQDLPPVTTIDLGKSPVENVENWPSHREQIFGRRNDGASTSGVNPYNDASDDIDSDSDNHDEPGDPSPSDPTTTYEPIGNDGNRERQNIVNDVIANVDREMTAEQRIIDANYRWRHTLIHMNESFTTTPQGEVLPETEASLLEALNDALGAPLPANPGSLFRQTVNTALPTTDTDELMELARNTALPVDDIQQATDRRSQVKAADKYFKLKKINGKRTASSAMRRYNILSSKIKDTKFSVPGKKEKVKR